MDNGFDDVALPNDDSAGPPAVDVDDYDRWVENFGNPESGQGGGGTGVPEPGAAVMTLVAILAAGACRRRLAS
jgi:hypothetical protein